MLWCLQIHAIGSFTKNQHRARGSGLHATSVVISPQHARNKHIQSSFPKMDSIEFTESVEFVDLEYTL